MCRWSKLTVSWATTRGLTLPLCTQGRSRNAPTHRMAPSPGLMIGVPPSMPKTPTLVIVKVPPGQVGRRRTAVAGGAHQPVEGVRELRQRHLVGVLDVGDQQPARSRCRDAEVDVVAVDDFLRRPVEVRVQVGRAPQAEQDRARHEQQRAHPGVGEARRLAQPPDQLDRPRDVDLDPLRDVRGRERAADHRLGHVLAHALDGLASLAVDETTADAGSTCGDRALEHLVRRPVRPYVAARRARRRG